MTTFEIGEAFENWCLDNLFLFDNKKGFDLLDKNVFCKHKVKSNEKPDFEIYCNKNKIKFFIECKYLSSTDRFYNSETIIMKKFQLKNHYEISKKNPVFYIFGVGGKPHNPKYLYIAPFKVIRNETKIDVIRMFKTTTKKRENFKDILT